MELNAIDLFCGAGGSTTGLKGAGIDVVQAANHWDLAIQTHAHNHPETAHACVDLHQEHPASFRATTLLWASPECRVHSPAGGRRRKSPGQIHLWENIAPSPADIRSRMTAWDVLRCAEFHRQPFVIVENVVEFADWELFDDWLKCFHTLGYRHQLVSFNSQFAYPNPVPQSRDRLYVVFHQQGEQSPNVDFRPPGHCQHCEGATRFVQSWKNPLNKVGRYGDRQQYLYCCESCGRAGVPCQRPARAAIDWSLPTIRIGDREKLGLKPLSPNTVRRIEKGLKRFFPQALLTVSYGTDGRSQSVDVPAWTVTGSNNYGVVEPFLTAYHGGRDATQKVDVPAWTIATNNQYGIVEPFLDVLRTNSQPISLSEPSATVTAQGNHHALVQPFISSYYGNGGESPVDSPSPTMKTRQGHALIEPDWSLLVENCGYRMLKPHEAKALMGFPSDYVLLGNQQQQFKQAGNAVTPPVAAMLGTAIKDSLCKQAWV